MVREGDLAPDFTLRSDSGDEVSLSSLRGRPVVLCFYPRDETPASLQAVRLEQSHHSV